MPSPFPGMNPYLEHPAFWSSFHTRLMVAIAEAIEPQLSPHYYEELLIGIPDAIVFAKQEGISFPEMPSAEETAVATQPRPEIVTVYEKKHRLILGSETHLVELDLLRGAKPMTIFGTRSDSPYRILISRSQHRPKADLYSISLQHSLPNFPIPLKPGEPEPSVPLQAVFDHVYERARYSSRIDYWQPVPPPKLSEADQQWVEALLAPLRGG